MNVHRRYSTTGKITRQLLVLLIAILILSLAAGCRTGEQEMSSQPALGAGFRYSSYGPPYDPGPEYWANVGLGMAERFPEAVPQAIWIIGRLQGQGVFVNFPVDSDDPYIYDLSTDINAPALELFDELGVQVWLQVEPGMADVETLIHAMLETYGQHPCVIGVGVDVEWYQSYETPEGQAVSDEIAEAWVAAARSHGEQYRVFLKHWLPEKMPPTYRDGLVFIDDSQMFDSFDAMISEFKAWGEYFAPAPVGFQYGYLSDRAWWKQMQDPPAEIGQAILEQIPNTEGLYWVDFTVFEIFPP